MGQQWNILSLDTRARICGAKLGEFFWDRQGSNLVYLLAKNEKPRPFVHLDNRGSFAIVSQEYAPILKLPTELLTQIFEELDEESCLPLTMTCQMLWHVGWKILERMSQKWYSSWNWAGSRIIFLGECCGWNKHPHGLLTVDEEKELKCGFHQHELDWMVEIGEFDEDHRLKPGNPVSLSDLAYLRYARVDTHRAENLRLLCKTEYWDQVPSPERRITMNFCMYAIKDHFPSTEIWIMRNLTAKEFVRGDYLYNSFQEGECPHGPNIGYPGLREAVFSRVCWSPNISTAPVASMCKGPWVGHRFEIRCLSGHISDSDASWKDVSLEVATELSLICNMELRSPIKNERIEAK